MSTKLFQEFLEQLHATGRMKADGYDLSLFHKLSVPELHKAENLLIEALDRGDWNGIEALCQIGSSKAIQALEELFPKVADNRFLKFKLAVYLHGKTGKSDYAVYMKPDLIGYDDTDRLSFVRYIPLLADATSYIDALYSICLEDTYSVVRFYAGVSILKVKHVIQNEDEIELYRPVLSQLAHKDQAVRRQGINEIKRVVSSNL